MSHLDIKLKQMQRGHIRDDTTQTYTPVYRHIHTQTNESNATNRQQTYVIANT